MRANVTRVAEGFDRRSFTVAETLRMQHRALKARLYARHRVREFWVVDAARRATFVHREPEGEGWRSIVERGPEEPLTLAALPGFSSRLGAV